MAAKNQVTVVIAGENQTEAAFRALRNQFAGVNKDVQGFQSAMGQLQSLMGGLGVGLLARELFQLGKGALDSAENINKLSEKTGISTQLLSDMAHAAKMGDVEFGAVEVALRKLSKAMAAAAGGSSEAQKAFRAVGVSVTDSAGQLRPMDKVLLDVAEKFSHMQDGAGKSALALQLFGRSGTDLIPMLNQGSAGLASMFEEAKRLGVELDPGTAAAATAVNDEFKRLQTMVDGLALSMVRSLLPALQQIIQNIKDNSAGTEEYRQKLEALATTFKVVIALVGLLQSGFDLGGANIRNMSAAILNLQKGDFAGALASWEQHLRDVKGVSQETLDGLRALFATVKAAPTFGAGLIGPPLPPGFGQKSQPSFGGGGAAAKPDFIIDLTNTDLRTPAQLLDEIAKAIQMVNLAAGETGGAEKFLSILGTKLPTGWPDELRNMETQIDGIFAKLNIDTEAVLGEVGRGQISEIAGAQKIVDLHRATGVELEALLPKYRELAALTGDPKLGAGVEDLAVRVKNLSNETNVLGNHIRDVFENDFANAVANIATGTESIGDAFKNMAKSVIGELVRIIAKMFIIWILSKLLGGIFGGGGGGIGSIAGVAGGLAGHQQGGHFSAGEPFIAGERGLPELIVPQSAGVVLSNSRLGRMQGGGDSFYIDARGADIGVEQRIRNLEHTMPRTVGASVRTMFEYKRRS